MVTNIVVNSIKFMDEQYLTIHPYIEIGKIAQNTKPTIVSRGVTKGYSLPIYASDDEEIFMCSCVPWRWNESSNPILTIPVYLDTANTSKNFKMQVSWEHYNPQSDIVTTSSNDIEIETATGTAAQYQSFRTNFTIDYDIDGVGHELTSYERLCFRIRRIAASANEIAGEIVMGPPAVRFIRNKV